MKNLQLLTVIILILLGNTFSQEQINWESKLNFETDFPTHKN